MKAISTIIAVLLISGLGVAAEDQPDLLWAMQRGNPARDGRSDVAFDGQMGQLWASPEPSIMYSYKQGQIGSGPCIYSVNDKNLIVIGSYDRKAHAYDALTGSPEWEFTTGNAVTATPCFAVIDGKPMLFVISSDRIVYGLDPTTGDELYLEPEKVWRYEVYPWSDTVSPAAVGDPMVVDVDGQPVLFFTMWINDLKSSGNVQESALYALDPKSAKLLWKSKIGSGRSAAPTFGKVKDEPAVFVTHEGGAVFAFSARDGKMLWNKPFVSESEIRSGISYCEVNGRRLLFFGSRLYSIFCVEADTGKNAWNDSLYVGTWVDATPAIYYDGDSASVLFGDYQQVFRRVNALTGETEWEYVSYGYFSASPTIIERNGEPAVANPCLDNSLYILNIEDGRFLHPRPDTGDFLWSHYQKGDTVWPSAAVARLDGKPILAYHSYDGRLHVYGEGGEPADLGPPQTQLIDAFGGSMTTMVLLMIAIVAALSFSGWQIARKILAERKEAEA